jgi:hypothetical protein
MSQRLATFPPSQPNLELSSTDKILVPTDKILERFQQIQWRYAPNDTTAAGALSRRIVETGHRGSLICIS